MSSKWNGQVKLFEKKIVNGYRVNKYTFIYFSFKKLYG